MDAKLIAATWLAWRRFVDEANEGDLLSFIENNEELGRLPAAVYPRLHRIRDIVLHGQGFRVSRAVIDDSEQLFFTEIANPNLEEPGVPDWVTGAKLRAWIKKEDVSPSKDSVDWEAFR